MRLRFIVAAFKYAALTTVPFISAIGISTFASSASSGENQEATLEEVYVTAEKRSQEVSDVPISIQVLDATFIENGANLGLSDLEYAMPSVNFGRGGRRTRGEITIRGVGGFSRNIGSNGRVAVYIDEVPLGRSSAFDSNLLDIEQIEILRGPQGTLFGENSIAGAINITTATPTDTQEAKLRQTFGSDGLQIFNASAASSIGEESAVRVQYSRIEADGFIQNNTRETSLQGRETDSFRGKFNTQFSDKIFLTLSGDWLEEDVDAINGEAIGDVLSPVLGLPLNGFSEAPNPFEVSHDTHEYETRKIWGIASNLEIELATGAKIKSISAIRRSLFEDVSEEDFTAAPIADSTFNESFKQKSQEIRYISPSHKKFDYVAGVFFSEGEITTDRSARLLNPDFVSSSFVTTPGTLHVDTTALFFTSNFYFNDRLSLTLGARAQHEKKAIEYTLDNPASIPPFDSGEFQDDKTFSNVLPKIGINLKNEKQLLFASISKGSTSGGWNADFVEDLSTIAFDQEKATSLELGHKFGGGASPLRSSVTAFLTKYTDFQVFQSLDGLITLTNAGEATSSGVEIDLEYALSPNLSARLGASYNDAEFDKFEDGNREGQDYSGNPLPYAPKRTFFTSLSGELFLVERSFFWHIDYSFTDDFYTDPSKNDNFLVKNYGLFNANIGIEITEMITAKSWIKNALDNDRLRFKDVSLLGVPRGYGIPPRSIGASIELKF